MLRRFVHALCPLAVLLAATFTFAQAEFSAEIVNQGKESSEPTKVYFAKDKMRIEGLEHGGRGGNGALHSHNWHHRRPYTICVCDRRQYE